MKVILSTLIILLNQFNFSQTLPVELTYFYGEVEDGKINLYWGTATELNNYGFFIERSLNDSSSFSEIGFVMGHGTSFSPKDYSFRDTTANLNEVYFYRLKQMDNDGGIKYSWIIRVPEVTRVNFISKMEENTKFGIYPNPSNEEVNVIVEVDKPGFASLILYDSNGRKLFSIFEGNLFSVHKFYVNMSTLSSGIYFINLRVGKKTFNERLIHLK